MCMFLSLLFLFEMCVLGCYETFFASSDNHPGFKRGLSSSHVIYTVKSVVNENCDILSRSRVK